MLYSGATHLYNQYLNAKFHPYAVKQYEMMVIKILGMFLLRADHEKTIVDSQDGIEPVPAVIDSTTCLLTNLKTAND